MEFTGEKTNLAKPAKVFGILGGMVSVAGIVYFVITKFSNALRHHYMEQSTNAMGTALQS